MTLPERLFPFFSSFSSSFSSSFPFRAHGANPEKFYLAAGLPMPDNVIDFSTNTNVLPWEGDLNIDLRRCLSAYPDDGAAELRERLAERARCAPENVLVLNGSNEGICLAASFLTGKRAAVLQPAYGEYLRALSAYGAEVRNLFSPEDPTDDSMKGTDALFICNPCNPTGAYIESARLESLFARYPQTLFVVDEAYIDFLVGEDRPLDFLSHENVVVLRSLTKIFHLCGARIGYVLGGADRIARMKARQPVWSVNAVAQAAALAFLRDGRFIERTRAFYAGETPRFMRRVEQAGFAVRPTRTHFFLIEVAETEVAKTEVAETGAEKKAGSVKEKTETGSGGKDEALIRALLERGLVVRHTRNFPGLDGRYIRASTRLPEENDKLARALRDLRSRTR